MPSPTTRKSFFFVTSSTLLQLELLPPSLNPQIKALINPDQSCNVRNEATSFSLIAISCFLAYVTMLRTIVHSQRIMTIKSLSFCFSSAFIVVMLNIVVVNIVTVIVDAVVVKSSPFFHSAT